MKPYLGSRFRLSFASARTLADLDAEVTEFSKVVKLYFSVKDYPLEGKLNLLYGLAGQDQTGKDIEEHIKIARRRAASIAESGSQPVAAVARGRSSP